MCKISQNRHVAECLLNEEGDIEQLIYDARRSVDPDDSPNLTEALAGELECYVKSVIKGLENDRAVLSLFAPAAMYMYMRDVEWECVAELVLEHAPVAA